jgi:site-specific DNA recombinase
MTRVALYARYSMDGQNAASITDQFQVCRSHAERERWQVVETYHDAAVSGASITLRPGVQTLLQDAQRGAFDIVLAEALDRVSRDQADVATLFKHLRFAGVEIVTLAEGEISELHVGLKGTMNALFLKDLAAKTHRGLQGRVAKGKSGGGISYGYEVVKRLDSEGEPIRGERMINPQEAEIVRRIFQEFAAGRSPLAIVRDLNAEGVPGPFGRTWSASTVRGHPTRRNGLLFNELYVGVLVWNRQRFIKNPSTGKRVARPNPEDKWIRTEVPELRIIDDALWAQVKSRQQELAKQFEFVSRGVLAARAKRLNELRRPVHLLSGLLTCGVCGGKYGIIASGRYGCLDHAHKGGCGNGRTIRLSDLEQRVLSGLTESLVSPEAVAVAVRAFSEQTNRENHGRRAQAEADRRALEKIERGVSGIMAAIEDGMYQPAMKARMAELERQKAEIEVRLANAPADMPDVHPNIAELYRAKMGRLAETLNEPAARHEAREDIRSLVGEVVLTPGAKRGEVHAVLRGDLLGILEVAGGRRRPSQGVMTKADAGPRTQAYPPPHPQHHENARAPRAGVSSCPEPIASRREGGRRRSGYGDPDLPLRKAATCGTSPNPSCARPGARVWVTSRPWRR